MRIAWMPVALLLAGRIAAAAELTAYVTVDGVVGAYAAKRLAGSIFKRAGIVIVWEVPPVEARGVAPWVRIEMADATPSHRLPGALAVAYPFSGCAKRITVFSDRVRAAAGRIDREPPLLAYVLVHEIAHVLEGVDAHSETGVMKARWNANDQAEILQGRWGLLPEDVWLIRHGLEMGGCHKPGALTARSGSGTAFRPE